MSVTLPSVRTRVRIKVRDSDNRNPSFSIIEVDQAIRDAYIALQSQLPPASVYSASAFTIAGGGDTFALPTSTGTIEYHGKTRIRLRSNGQFLRERTVEEIDAMRNGQTTTGTGVPTDFALWEENDQEVQGRCYPGAKSAEVCDLFYTLVADDFDLTAIDSSNIRFSRYGIDALVYRASAELVMTLTEEDLKLRKLNANAANFWLKESERILYREAMRQHRIGAVGRTQRNIA